LLEAIETHHEYYESLKLMGLFKVPHASLLTATDLESIDGACDPRHVRASSDIDNFILRVQCFSRNMAIKGDECILRCPERLKQLMDISAELASTTYLRTTIRGLVTKDKKGEAVGTSMNKSKSELLENLIGKMETEYFPREHKEDKGDKKFTTISHPPYAGVEITTSDDLEANMSTLVRAIRQSTDKSVTHVEESEEEGVKGLFDKVAARLKAERKIAINPQELFKKYKYALSLRDDSGKHGPEYRSLLSRIIERESEALRVLRDIILDGITIPDSRSDMARLLDKEEVIHNALGICTVRGNNIGSGPEHTIEWMKFIKPIMEWVKDEYNPSIRDLLTEGTSTEREKSLRNLFSNGVDLTRTAAKKFVDDVDPNWQQFMDKIIDLLLVNGNTHLDGSTYISRISLEGSVEPSFERLLETAIIMRDFTALMQRALSDEKEKTREQLVQEIIDTLLEAWPRKTEVENVRA
jgi:hypothetical protein